MPAAEKSVKGYGRVPLSILRNPALSLITKALFCFFCVFSYDTGEELLFEGYREKQIEDALGICHESFVGSISTLIDNNLINVVNVKVRGKQLPNIYHINRYLNGLSETKDIFSDGFGFVPRQLMLVPINAQAKAVLCYIYAYARDEYIAELNVGRIANELDVNADTIKRHLRNLREKGLVISQPARKKGRVTGLIIEVAEKPTKQHERRKKQECEKQTTDMQTTEKRTAEKQTAEMQVAYNSSKKKNSTNNNEQILINSDEEDVPSEERIRNLLVDTGTLPTTLLTNKTERDMAVRLLITEALIEQPPSHGAILCCRALSSMLTPGRITKIDGEIIDSAEVLNKVRENILCDSTTMWIPQLVMDEVLDRVEDALMYDNIIAPLNYAQKCIFNFFWLG